MTHDPTTKADAGPIQLPVRLTDCRQDIVNGGYLCHLHDADGTWLGDLRAGPYHAQKTEAVITALNATARHDKLVDVLKHEIPIIQCVRNTLHAHNRPDQPLRNDDRISCRGLLEGAIRRLDEALDAAKAQ